MPRSPCAAIVLKIWKSAKTGVEDVNYNSGLTMKPGIQTKQILVESDCQKQGGLTWCLRQGLGEECLAGKPDKCQCWEIEGFVLNNVTSARLPIILAPELLKQPGLNFQ